MVSKIHFIRHGITEGNQKKWFYGQADIPVTQEGLDYLAKLREDGIYPELPEDADFYTSGLLRTEQTFKVIFGEREHRSIKKLQEMNFGEYECKTYEESKGNPEFDKWAWDETGKVALPGGESKIEFSARISEGLKELRGYHRLKEFSHRHSGKDAVSVIVCHGGVIGSMMYEMFPDEKENMWAWIPDPGFGYSVSFENSEPVSYERIAE